MDFFKFQGSVCESNLFSSQLFILKNFTHTKKLPKEYTYILHLGRPAVHFATFVSSFRVCIFITVIFLAELFKRKLQIS